MRSNSGFMTNNGKSTIEDVTRWAVIQGVWDINKEELLYKGGPESFQAHGQLFAMGLAISNRAMQHGRCRVDLKFAPSEGGGHFAGGLVIGFRAPERYYVQVQLGAGPAAYTVSEFVPGFGWKPIYSVGPQSLLQPDRTYTLEAEVQGQEIRVKIDSVQILEVLLSRPLEGKQTGLIAAGSGNVHFSNLKSAVTSRGPSLQWNTANRSTPSITRSSSHKLKVVSTLCESTRKLVPVSFSRICNAKSPRRMWL
jgi:hypothetical protein